MVALQIDGPVPYGKHVPSKKITTTGIKDIRQET